ncbi:MAG: class I SAM-dependent methyltransferase [bacterium]
MTPENVLTREQILPRWSEFVQSPAQLAYSRLCKFPPGNGGRLVEVMNLEPDERILEVGCGLGILSGRLLETGVPSTIVGCEVDPNLLETSLPQGLAPENLPTFVRASGFGLPFPDNSFQRVLSHTLVNLLTVNEWKKLHSEIRRVLSPGGEVTHMDGMGGSSWTPESLEPLDEEEERRSRFRTLLRQVHEELETGFVNSVKDLPDRLEESGFDSAAVDVYASMVRLNNPNWNEAQKKLLLELRQRAERDRVERLRNLLEARGSMTDERGDLLRKCISDAQQQALRRRKALEENRELGWFSSSTLVGTAKL